MQALSLWTIFFAVGMTDFQFRKSRLKTVALSKFEFWKNEEARKGASPNIINKMEQKR